MCFTSRSVPNFILFNICVRFYYMFHFPISSEIKNSFVFSFWLCFTFHLVPKFNSSNLIHFFKFLLKSIFHSKFNFPHCSKNSIFIKKPQFFFLAPKLLPPPRRQHWKWSNLLPSWARCNFKNSRHWVQHDDEEISLAPRQWWSFEGKHSRLSLARESCIGRRYEETFLLIF